MKNEPVNKQLEIMFPCDCGFLKGFAFKKGDPCEGCWQGKVKKQLLALIASEKAKELELLLNKKSEMIPDATFKKIKERINELRSKEWKS